MINPKHRFLFVAAVLTLTVILFVATNTATRYTFYECLRPVPNNPAINIDFEYYDNPITYKLEKKGFPFVYHHEEPDRCGSEILIKELSLALFVVNAFLWLGTGAFISYFVTRRKNKNTAT